MSQSGSNSSNIPTQELNNIAIIGGGYVGAALANYWHQQQYNVTVTTTRETRLQELETLASQVIVLKGEDSSAIHSLLQNQDTIVVCIAPISDRQVDANIYRETYIPTVKNLSKTIKKTPTVQQIVYLSSCSVYGNQAGALVDETTPVDTESEYNKVLTEAEKRLLDAATEQTKITILRLGGIYGPERKLTTRFGKLAGQIMSGSGDTVTPWIHLDDILSAIDLLCRRRATGIYNLVNDFNLTIRELSDQLCELQGIEKIIWDDTKPSYRSLNARIDNQKIKSIGYQLIHPDTII